MNKQQQKETQQKAGETVTEKPTTFDISIKPKNPFHAWLIKRNLSPATRHILIKPQRVVNIYRIAARAVNLDTGELFKAKDSLDQLRAMLDIMSRHGDDIFYIVAAAIQNDHREPTEQILRIVKDEFEMQDLFTVLTYAVSNYNINAFLNSIALITGVDALEIKKASPEVNGG